MTDEERYEVMIDEIERLKNQNNALQEHNRRLVKELQKIVRCKDCIHGEHIQISLWENRDIDKAPSQFHNFIKCHKFHIKGFNETLYVGDDDYCSYGERKGGVE